MNRIPRFTRLVAALGLGLSLATTLLASRPAQAEGEIRIAEQFGIVYLLLNVVRDQRLIEKHGQAEGLQIKVDWTQLSGGAAVNDALLSGAIDIAGAGVGPLLTIWDRTRGRQNVKAVASLGNFPYYLLSNDPRVRSIADFGAGDRIAVPAVGVSVQSRFLQYAAAKQWGDKQFDRLDKYTVALPHPDATAALVAGGTELTGHFSNPPFQDQALANPKVHVVLDSYELLGPNSPTVLFATEKFRQDNPKTYRAFVEALKEAAAFAQNDKAAAADTYIRVTGAKIDRAALLKIIANPQVEFSVTPKNTYPLAEFLYRVGAIRNKPASWQDYFFQTARRCRGVETPMNAASRQPSTLPADALLAVDGVSLEYRTRSRVVRATNGSASKSTRPIASSCSARPVAASRPCSRRWPASSRPARARSAFRDRRSGRPAPTVSWCSRSSTSCRHGRPYGRTCCSPCGCPAR